MVYAMVYGTYFPDDLSAQNAAWYEAVRASPDELNIDEFLSFTHPEQSHSLLLRVADDLFVALDNDGNDAIVFDEFQNVHPDDVGLGAEKIRELFEMDDKKKLFEFVDADGDGKIRKNELLVSIFYFGKNSFIRTKE